MLADFLPLLQEVQLEEEIVRELNQQLLQSKHLLHVTQSQTCVSFHCLQETDMN